MAYPYLIRVALESPRTLSRDELQDLEAFVERQVDGNDAQNPLPKGAVIQCVEAFEACPCCNEWVETCPCLFEPRSPAQWCLDHERMVPL